MLKINYEMPIKKGDSEPYYLIFKTKSGKIIAKISTLWNETKNLINQYNLKNKGELNLFDWIEIVNNWKFKKMIY